MDVRQQVGENLRRFRRTRGLTQMELSDRSGLDQTYISGIETGQRNPTIVVLDELAKVLDVPIVEFFEGYLPKKCAAAKR